MKTGSISFITLCGALAGFSPVVLGGQTADAQADTQTAGAATVTIRAKGAELSAGLAEIVKLQKAGVNESVILTFIQNSPVPYHPSAEEIIKVHELGMSSPIIIAMLRRGSEVRQHAAKAQKEVESSETPTNYQTPAVSTVPPATAYYAPPVTSPSVVYASYPAYSYVTAAPYYYGGYYYPSYYYGGFYPAISFGARFGGGHFGGGHFGGGHFGGGHFGGGHFGGGHFGGGHYGGSHFVGHQGGFGHRH